MDTLSEIEARWKCLLDWSKDKMAGAFSTNAEEAFTRSIKITERKKMTDSEIELYYEIAKCVEFIKKNNYSTVRL